MYKLIILLFTSSLLFGCTSRPKTDDRTLYVSILPLRSIVQGIVGDDFDIEVLVPAGVSPETFEPTPKQFIALNNSQLIFNVGLIDFENRLISKVSDPSKVIDLSKGITLIEGSCSHSHGNHSHGIDPHVWTSPHELKTMAANAYEAINEAWPDSTKYTTNYKVLKAEIERLDTETADRISSSGIEYILVYHPAMTYYARAYGIRQVAVENEGKEPSAKRLSEIIGTARHDSVKKIFYQSQFPASSVQTIADDIGAMPTEIDPLAENAIENIRHITTLLTE